MGKVLKIPKRLIDSRYAVDTLEDYLGCAVYLIRREQLFQPCRTSYRLLNEPGRTNMSHEPRVTGWLGATDNITAHALGYFLVTGQSTTHLHLTKHEPPPS